MPKSPRPIATGLAALAALVCLARPARAALTSPPNQFVQDVQASLNWCTENPHVMGTGDFNGDGYIDIYCHSLLTGKTWIAYAANAGGTLTFSGYGSPIGLTGWCYGGTAQFGVLDIDGNGFTDFYCHDTGGGGSNWIATNKGGGTFQSAFLGSNWCGPGYTFTITDLDGDGRSDALCFTPASGAVYIATSNGTGWVFNGSLKIQNFCAGTGGNLQFGVADFNNDHKVDVFCHDFNSGNTSVALSGGTWLNAPTNWMTGWCIGGQGFGIGDFDGDKFTDVWCYNNGNYTVALNWDSLGAPALVNAGNYATGYCNGIGTNTVVSDKGARYVSRYPHFPSLDALYFNNDARTDVACRNDGATGRVTGGLSDPANARFVQTDIFYTVSNFCQSGSTLLTGDFNGDGSTDLACTTGTTTQIHHSVTWPITYHGGGVVTAPVTLDLIFYGPDWAFADLNVLENFAVNLSGSPYWGIMGRFNDGTGGHTVPTTFNVVFDFSPAYSEGTTLGWDELKAVAANLHGTPDPHTVYVVLFDTTTTDADYGGPSGAHENYGGYNLAWVGNPGNNINGSMGNCLLANQTDSPNHAPIADCMIPTLTHEFAEALTDPYGTTGWNVNPAQNSETGDMCTNWWINLLYTQDATVYTQTLNGLNYLVPSLEVPIDPYTSYCGYRP